MKKINKNNETHEIRHEKVKKSISWYLMRILNNRKYAKIAIVSGFAILIISQILTNDTVKDYLGKFIPFLSQSSDDAIPINVKTIIAKETQITPTVNVLGTIDYYEKIDISSKVSGKIEKIYPVEGSKVKKGQIIIEIEKLPLQLERKKNIAALAEAVSSDKLAGEKLLNKRKEVEAKLRQLEKLSATVKEYKAQLIKTRATFEGKAQLYNEEGISAEEYNTMKTNVITVESQYINAQKDLEMAGIGYRDSDIEAMGFAVPTDIKKKFEILVNINSRMEKAEKEMTEARIKSEKASLESTETLLKECTIRSPITSYVALRNKNVGEQVNGGSASSSEAIMVLVDINKVFVKIDMNESDVINIKTGDTLSFTADIYPKKTFNGIITSINPIIDQRTHTAQIKAIFQNSEEIFRPGNFIRSKVVTGEPFQAVLVPSKSVIPIENNTGWVFIAKNGKAFKSNVITGNEDNEEIEVISGISRGDLVIIDKLNQLREGASIELEKTTDAIKK